MLNHQISCLCIRKNNSPSIEPCSIQLQLIKSIACLEQLFAFIDIRSLLQYLTILFDMQGFF